MRQCDDCPCDNDSYVPSSGPSDVDVMVVGEAPGRTEVEEKKPFVGRSGQLLEAAFEDEMGRDLRDCYLTNVVKCRPAGNATPTKSMIQECRPTLMQEIDDVQPDFILAVGATASREMTGISDGVWSLRSRIVENFGAQVMPTIHPAQCLRKESVYRDFQKDLRKFHKWVQNDRERFRDVTGNDVPYHYIQSPVIFEDYWTRRFQDYQGIAVCDIETTGLDWKRDEITELGMFLPSTGLAWIIDGNILSHPKVHGRLKSWFELGAIRFIWHNGRFDVKFFREQYNICARVDGDTQLQSYTLDERTGAHSLSYISRYYLNAPDYQQEFKETLPSGVARHAYWEAPQDKRNEYLSYDVYFPYLLDDIFDHELTDKQKNLCHDIHYPLTNVLADVERNGLKVDQDYLETIDVEFKSKLDHMEARMRNIAQRTDSSPKQYVKETDAKTKPDFLNPRSPKQMAYMIMDVFNLPSYNERTTNKDALNWWISDIMDKPDNGDALDYWLKSDKHRFVWLLKKYREDHKLWSQYINGLWDHIEDDGRVYTNFLQHGTESGRLSSRDPNVQNISRDDRIRDIFIADDDYVLMDADYSQAELRTLAVLSDDQFMLDAYDKGSDLHTEMAKAIFGENFTKEERVKTKNVNFACVTMDAQAVTEDGYKSYSEIEIGDKVLGYNQEQNQIEWTQVLRKEKYENAPVVEMSHSKFKATVTPNHRWYGDKRRQKGPNHDCKRWYEPTIFWTNEINQTHRIQVSAKGDLNNENPPNISPLEAELIAWIVTDGYIQISPLSPSRFQGLNKERQLYNADIYQKKEKYVRRIRKKFDKFIRSEKQRDDGLIRFHLKSPKIRDVWRRAKLDSYTWPQFVLSLSNEQRQRFLAGCYFAEGHRKQGQKVISQNKGPLAEAIRLCILLAGYSPSPSERKQYTGNMKQRLAFRRPYIGTQTMKFERQKNQDVWCIETELGSWVMHQHNQLMITGNTLYGAGPEKVALQTGATKSEAARWMSYWEDNAKAAYEYLEAAGEKAITDHEIETPFGRKRRIPLTTDSNDGEAQRTFRNFIIQSTANDLLFLAAIELHQEIQAWRHELDFQIVNLVHDSILFEVHQNNVEMVASIVKDTMEDVAEKALDSSIPFTSDIEVGEAWGSLKEYDVA